MKSKILSILSAIANGMIAEYSKQFQFDGYTVNVINYIKL
jgi:hypothetical protein